MDATARSSAAAIVQRHGLPDLLSRVVAGRGVGIDDVEAYLAPTLRAYMPDPSVLTDLDRMAERLADAIEARESVAIFGDYDVDGATSASVLGLFLRSVGVTADVHIPDRITEGYGPNREAIAMLASRGARLLVTVDCGTTSHEVLGSARDHGLDVLVIDHHQADETLPAVSALVNPNRQDDLSGLGHVCAAGVTMMVVVGTNRELRRRGFYGTGRPEPDLTQWLDLVALGTVADVVPLRGLNRAFVTRGLSVMRARTNIGLRALMDVARLDGPPQPYHLGFLLGPRINAGGRIGDAALGARLMMTVDPVEASRLASELDRLNRERQVVEQATVAEAEAEALMALGGDAAGASVLVTAGDTWHPGVVGLVASRLKERFQRPCFAISMDGETGVGSGRSIPGVDLGQAVRQAVHLGILAKGGGHAMAAGITLSRSRIGAFRAFLENHLSAAVEQGRREAAVLIDGAVTARRASLDLHAEMERAGPFGSGNPEPVLAFPDHRIAFVDAVGAGHLKVRLTHRDGASVDAIAFRAAEQPLGERLVAARGTHIHVAGTLGVNRWQGQERIQIRIIDAAASDPRAA